eukprot:7275555-Karenia_brevis.AAC.1
MSQDSSRANLAVIYYTLGTLDYITTQLKSQSCCYLLHFEAHWTMSQHNSRANLAAICYTVGTLDHVKHSSRANLGTIYYTLGTLDHITT